MFIYIYSKTYHIYLMTNSMKFCFAINIAKGNDS